MSPDVFPVLNPRNFILISLVVASLGNAAPEWKDRLSPASYGDHPRLQPTALDYQVSWKGVINSGYLHMEFDPPAAKKANVYVVKAHATTQGIAASLHPYEYTSWSELSPVSLLPRYVKSNEMDSNGTEITIAKYFGNRVESETTSKSAKTGKSEVTRRNFALYPVFDIFSSMLYIRSQPLAAGDRLNIVIQSSDQPYLLHVLCLGRERHNGTNTIKLSAGMNKIERDSLELKPYKKLKNDAILWLSDDEQRVPLEVRADIFLGDVRMVLTQNKKI